MRAAKVQVSLRIRAVSPEPPLLAHASSESRGTFRQKARSLAPLNDWACAVKICHDGMLEDTNSLYNIWAAAWQNQQNDLCVQRRPSMGIRQVWSESLLCTLKEAIDLKLLHVDGEDSDQTGRMPILIWVYTWRTGHFVGFVMLWLICCSYSLESYWRKDVQVNRLGSLPRNSVVRLTDCLDMTIVVDWDVKPQIKQTKNKQTH